MQLASRAGAFTYFYIFSAKKFTNQRNEKKNQKNQEKFLKKVKELIMMDEIVNEDIEKNSKKAQRKQ